MNSKWQVLESTYRSLGCLKAPAKPRGLFRSRNSINETIRKVLAVGFLGVIGLVNLPLAYANNVDGAWSTLEDWPLIAIHGAITPDARVLSYGTKGDGKQTGYFIYDIWDPAAGLSGGHVTLDNLTLTDIFCSSQIILPQSGDILIVGGDNWTGTGTTNTGNVNSNLFDYSSNSLTRSSDMSRARWYSSSTALVNGEIYIQGGAGGGDLPEVREISGGFRLLDGAPTGGYVTNFPRNFLAPDGRIFGYDTNGKMYFVDPDGLGSLSSAGQFSSSYVGWESSAAMFRPGQILQVGANSNGVVVIDINGPTPVITPTQSTSSQRRWVSATALADGKVLATGGSGVANQLTDVNNTAEIWDPDTGLWHVGSTGAVARLYHSSALLLPDATVLVAGGGAPGPLNNTNAEIYYPPYLYAPGGGFAVRPQIISVVDVAEVGDVLSVQVDASTIGRVTMVKTGSVTHSVNMDQRFVELPFTASGSMLDVTLPERASDTPPGFYMLFVIDDVGVPSVSSMLRINIDPTPNIAVDYTPTIGGGGGGPFQLACNSDEILVGIHGKTETYVNQVGPQCVTMDQLGRWIGDPTDGPVTGNKTSGTSFSKTCPRDFAMSGFEGRSGNYLTQLNIECKALTATGDLTGAGQLMGAVGNSGDNPQPLQSCGTGNPVYALYGRSGGWLDNFGVLCRQGVITPISINSTPVVVNPGAQLHFFDLPVNLQIGASDGDDDPLTFSATGLPTGLAIDTNSGLISGTPTVVGLFNPEITVTDGTEFVNTSFDWSITILPLAVDPMPSQAPQEAGTEVNYTATINGGQNVLYKWDFGDGTPETIYSASASIAHTFDEPGIYHVTLTVNDDVGIPAIQTFVQTIHLPATVNSPSNSTNITLESPLVGNARLWVVNQDNDSVSVFDTQTNVRLAEVSVGIAPRAVAVAADGRVWITNKSSATISIIDPVSLAVVQTVTLPYASQPFGIVFSPVANEALVVLEGSAMLLKLDGSSGAQLSMAATGQHPRHLSIDSSGSSIYVSLFVTAAQLGEATANVDIGSGGGEIQIFDSASMSYLDTIVLQHSDDVDAENQGRGAPNYIGAMAISPDGTRARVPSKKDNIFRGELRDAPLNLNFQNTVRAISSAIDLNTNTEVYANRIDYDDSGVASAVVFGPKGNYIFVALETSREVAVVDAYGATELFRVDVGRAPQGLAVSADGLTLYVNNFMDRNVEVLDLTALQSSGLWSMNSLALLPAITTEKLTAEVFIGKQFFYDARDTRLAFDAYISCASCHNDGAHDGRVWDLTGMGEGLRNTITLKGRSGSQGSLHWTENFDEVQDFEGQIRGLSSGTGLMSDVDFFAGTRSQPLGDAKAGISADLDALAAYVESLSEFVDSPHRNSDGSLTADAIAGGEIFQKENCAACHSGVAFTDSGSDNLHDIGTLKSSSGNRLGGPLTGIDTPTLRGIWSTAPYLHDGSAATLADAVTAHQGVSLTAGELAQLVSYLQQIDGQQSLAPLPKSSGLIAYWPMTEGAGGTAADVSGNGHTGTLVNGTQWPAGPGLLFDGVDDFLDAGTLDVAGTALTLSARVLSAQLDNCPGANDCRIISKAEGSNADDHYFTVSTILQSGETRLSFQLKTDGSTDTLIASSGGLTVDQWSHVAAAYDGAYMRLYLNGVEVGSMAKTGSVSTDNTVPLWIGANPTIAASLPWRGQIDEVRIYARALSSLEIVTLAADNRSPLTTAQNIDVTEDTPEPIVLTASDADDDLLTYNITSGPSNGVLSGTAPSLTYTPNAEFSGSDSFVFEVIDGNGGSDTESIVIDVLPVNDAPTALGEAYVLTADTSLNVVAPGVLANDSDIDSASLTAAVLTDPGQGSLLLNVDGSFSYTPNPGYDGADNFSYNVSDGELLSNTVLVDLTIEPAPPPNQLPVASNQNVSTDEDAALPILLQATDGNADALTFSVVSVPANGLLSGSAPNLIYTPTSNFNGADGFTFLANDGFGDGNIASVSIGVDAVNDEPIATAAAVETEENTAIGITLVASDVDGDSLSYSVTSGPSSGVLSGAAPNLTYTPSVDYSGSDSFIFAANDGNGGVDSATILITVNEDYSGDLNGNGRTDITDMLQVLRYLLGIDTLTQEELDRADVYPPGVGDGTVDISDWLLLQRMSVVQ